MMSIPDVTTVPQTMPQADDSWMPRHSGRDIAAGCIWLPRLIDKGRRILEGEASGRDLLGTYLFGVNDPADSQLLRFLGMTNDEALEVLRQQPDDDEAAAELVRRSGRTPAECAAWSVKFSRQNGPFLAMMDADENRRPAGLGTTALRVVYNRIIMPPAYPIYRLQERRRLAGQEGIGLRPGRIALGLGLMVLVVWLLWRLAGRRAEQ
jgi:hypothetical protein